MRSWDVANHRHQRDRQRRQKQLIAQTLRALLLLFIAALMDAGHAVFDDDWLRAGLADCAEVYP
jgi:hypothetical protein